MFGKSYLDDQDNLFLKSFYYIIYEKYPHWSSFDLI